MLGSQETEDGTQLIDMNVRRLAESEVITNEYKCIEFLRAQGVLSTRMNCPKCGMRMREEKTKTAKHDQLRWRCQTRGCRTTTTIRKNSFFENSKAELTKLILVIYFWAADAPQREMARESELSERTMVDWCNLLREVCTEELLKTQRKLGGPGSIIVLDETHLAKRKPNTNRGGRPVKPLWLMGGVDTVTKEAFMQLVPPEEGRTAEVLEKIITDNIADGSTIWTDKFPSYNGIENLGRNYTHETVNHSIEYVSSSGMNTQAVESLWNDVKRKFKRMNGVARHFIPGYLDEFMWRRQYPRKEQFPRILRAIRDSPSYDVNRG